MMHYQYYQLYLYYIHFIQKNIRINLTIQHMQYIYAQN